MIVFHDPVPVSQNPDRYRITWTAIGDRDGLTAGRTNWIEVADAEIAALEAWVVEGGALVLADLGPYRSAAIDRINTAAGELRRTFITAIPGQEMLYLAKETEARAFIADPAPDLANYPFIAAEIGPGLTAPDAGQLAQLWLNLGAQWRAVAAQIETARLGAVYAVEAAASMAEIAAIEAAYQGALP